MSLTSTHRAPRHRARTRADAARIGQYTGALLTAGGVAALALGHLAGAWAGLIGLAMVSGFLEHPRGVLAIAAHANPAGRLSDGEALRGLSPALRTAVLLRDIHELSYQEIAARLGIAEGTVKSRINRGRAELARQIERLRAESDRRLKSGVQK